MDAFLWRFLPFNVKEKLDIFPFFTTLSQAHTKHCLTKGHKTPHAVFKAAADSPSFDSPTPPISSCLFTDNHVEIQKEKKYLKYTLDHTVTLQYFLFLTPAVTKST